MIYDFCNFGNGTDYSLSRIFGNFLKETTSAHQLLKRRPQKLLNEFIRLPEKTKWFQSSFRNLCSPIGTSFYMLMREDVPKIFKTLIPFRPTFQIRSLLPAFHENSSRHFSTVRLIQPEKSKFTYLCIWRIQGRPVNGKGPLDLLRICWNF